MVFNCRVKVLRLENGLSKTDVAKQFGVTRRAIYAWEETEVYPDIDHLIQIAQFYQVSVDWLLGLKDERQDNAVKKEASQDVRMETRQRPDPQ